MSDNRSEKVYLIAIGNPGSSQAKVKPRAGMDSQATG
jgi:hypothetical protein